MIPVIAPAALDGKSLGTTVTDEHGRKQGSIKGVVRQAAQELRTGDCSSVSGIGARRQPGRLGTPARERKASGAQRSTRMRLNTSVATPLLGG